MGFVDFLHDGPSVYIEETDVLRFGLQAATIDIRIGSYFLDPSEIFNKQQVFSNEHASILVQHR